MHNLNLLVREHETNPKCFLEKQLPCVLEKCPCYKIQRKAEVTKETSKLNTVHNPVLDPGIKGKIILKRTLLGTSPHWNMVVY